MAAVVRCGMADDPPAPTDAQLLLAELKITNTFLERIAVAAEALVKRYAVESAPLIAPIVRQG